ncbi:hypothetical protein J6590_012265 [Homalodisca vitripennis]|nr:hypothetical protein J6590_012265 [Homalodisca vitripennis]
MNNCCRVVHALIACQLIQVRAGQRDSEKFMPTFLLPPPTLLPHFCRGRAIRLRSKQGRRAASVGFRVNYQRAARPLWCNSSPLDSIFFTHRATAFLSQ